MLERKQFQSTRFAVASHHHSRRELLACDMGQRALCTRVNHSEFQYVRGNPLYGCKHERVALCFLVFQRGIEPLPERTGFWFRYSWQGPTLDRALTCSEIATRFGI